MGRIMASSMNLSQVRYLVLLIDCFRIYPPQAYYFEHDFTKRGC